MRTPVRVFDVYLASCTAARVNHTNTACNHCTRLLALRLHNGIGSPPKRNTRQSDPAQPEQQKLQLGYLAYALTGNTDAQMFKINVGYSASNGKSCERQIHEACFGLYTTKLHKSTFDDGNQKRRTNSSLDCCPTQSATRTLKNWTEAS